jgi:hypothetical protein
MTIGLALTRVSDATKWIHGARGDIENIALQHLRTGSEWLNYKHGVSFAYFIGR